MKVKSRRHTYHHITRKDRVGVEGWGGGIWRVRQTDRDREEEGGGGGGREFEDFIYV